MGSNLKMNKALAERMEEAILESGMSQANISRAMSVDPSCITRWKKQTYRPRTKQLQQFADIVGVEVEWLLTGRGERTTTKTEKKRKPETEGHEITTNEELRMFLKDLVVAQAKIIELQDEVLLLREQVSLGGQAKNLRARGKNGK